MKKSKFKPGDIIVGKNNNMRQNIGMIQRISHRTEFYSVLWLKGTRPNQVLESSWYAIDNYFLLQEEPNNIMKEIL